jgi:hypothetical protein
MRFGVIGMQKGEAIVLLLLVAFLASWLTLRIRRWWVQPQERRLLPRMTSEHIPRDEAVELLEGAGFDVLAAKQRVPVFITLNDGDEPLESRLYIDYVARKQEQLYLVKVSKERRPLELTGSSIRDVLLPYHLLYPGASGVLYVDMHQQKIRKISFHIEV